MDFIARFEKVIQSNDPEKLKSFKLEVDIAIEAYAEISDYLKKQQYRWNKECETLCTLRNLIQTKLKGESP